MTENCNTCAVLDEPLPYDKRSHDEFLECRVVEAAAADDDADDDELSSGTRTMEPGLAFCWFMLLIEHVEN